MYKATRLEPSVELKINGALTDATSVGAGQSVTVSWEAQNVQSCAFVGDARESGGLSGAVNLSGSQKTLPLYQTSKFAIRCLTKSGDPLMKYFTVVVIDSTKTL